MSSASDARPPLDGIGSAHEGRRDRWRGGGVAARLDAPFGRCAGDAHPAQPPGAARRRRPGAGGPAGRTRVGRRQGRRPTRRRRHPRSHRLRSQDVRPRRRRAIVRELAGSAGTVRPERHRRGAAGRASQAAGGADRRVADRIGRSRGGGLAPSDARRARPGGGRGTRQWRARGAVRDPDRGRPHDPHV